MATSLSTAQALTPAPKAQRPALKAVRRFVRTQPLGALALVLILTMLVLGSFAPQLVPFNPLDASYTDVLVPPNAQHWMGTDTFGRDVFSRILYGTRPALLLGISTAFMGAIIGAIVGTTSVAVWTPYCNASTTCCSQSH